MTALTATATDAASMRSRGIVLMLLGVLLLTIMDVVAKHLMATYSVTQTIFIRQTLALPVLFLVLLQDGGLGALRLAQHRMQLMRGVLNFATGFTFFSAISVMPIANVLAIAFTAPLVVVLLSMPMLGEPVGRAAGISILLGFLGVLIVVRPDQGVLEPMAIMALISAVTYAVSIVMLRRLGARDTATVSAIYASGMSMLLAALFALDGSWLWPTAVDWPIFILAAMLGTFGTLAVAAAFRLAPAATLAPIDYTALIWAAGLGWVIFGDVPGASLLIGAALIILGGLVLARKPR